MKGIPYLFLTQLKNTVKELKHNPAKLILVVFVALMIGFVIFTGNMAGEVEMNELRPAAELNAMVFVLLLAVFVLSTLNGLNSGASFFSMADVNLLFATPIKPVRVLFYGLIKQMGTSLLVGFFLIFQYSWLHMTYGITVGALLLILLCYAVTMFCAQLTSMAIYSFTSGSEKAQRAIRMALYALVALVVIRVAMPFFTREEGGILANLVSAVNAPELKLFPVAGWMSAVSTGFLTNSALPVIAGFAAAAIYVGLILFFLVKSRSDFYEDVLATTEVSFSAITAKKEGNLSMPTPKNVKVGKTGLGKGSGASVFFSKHMLEGRRARVFLLDTFSLIVIAVCGFFAFFMKEAGLMAVFFMSVYMLIFTMATGRWAKEMLLPYIYLVPESSFQKLVMASLESILKIALESAAVMIVAGVIVGAPPADILVCILSRISFGLLFMAGDIMVERLMGSSLPKAMLVVMYMVMVIIISLPGIVGGILLSNLAPDWMAMITVFGISAVWNTLAAALIAFLCRNILDVAELNNK